ncbi:beta-glucoside-specific PTS transporter subunit IIABC [Bacillus sp. 179-C3.3 HS]|uniref:beta-glucoside-specific PTS transporter subunit IIABC n=1 Tax=Bacillus sp. 179-C3.3 HS TaxID=3232162 RepID=UPI0039A13AA7
MNKETLAKDILKMVGGSDNVLGVTHCATRLRFRINQSEKVEKSDLEQHPDILKVVESSGQLQVVIGSHVADVYKEIERQGQFDDDHSGGKSGEKQTIISRVFSLISGSLTPLIPAFAGAGLIKALLIVLENLNLLTPEDGTYAVLAAAGNAVFYFLPILLGVTIARVLGANPYVAGAIGAALLEPNFTALREAGNVVSFLGIPVPLLDYASSIFPIIIAVSLFALIESNLKKVIHKNLQIFAVPFLSILITVPLTTMLVGPFGVYLGTWLGDLVNFLINSSHILAGIVIGGAWSFLVLFGLHWAMVPIIIENLKGGSDLIVPLAAASIAAQMGIALGVFFKTKNKDMKALSGSTFLSAILSGITEPILYGIILRHRKTMIYMIVAGAIGGALIATFKVELVVFNFFLNVFTFPAQSPMGLYILGIVITIVIAAILPILFGYEVKQPKKEEADEKDPQQLNEQIMSPLSGQVKALQQVEDVVFSSEAMGKGIAIEPDQGEVVAPVDGVISVTMESGHAVGLVSQKGAEILIHVGIDTVKLEGKYFTCLVKQGDEVKQGQPLIRFELDKIIEAGYPISTPIVITNTDQYEQIQEVVPFEGQVQKNQDLLSLKKKS